MISEAQLATSLRTDAPFTRSSSKINGNESAFSRTLPYASREGNLIGRTIKTDVATYTLKRLIGRGGMSNVYLAEVAGNSQMPEYVAIKIVNDSVNTDLAERFIREQTALKKLTHPNIITLYDAGENFIVMPVATSSFRDQIEAATEKIEHPRITHQQSTPIQGTALINCLTTLAEICDALNYAHSQGIVHRDLKPGNILIGENGTPLLSDFGLISVDATSVASRSGEIKGTPHFMSPEQARGERIDNRSDIYSMGVLLYLLLTGRYPFDGDTSLAIAQQHSSDKIPLTPTTVIRELNGLNCRRFDPIPPPLEAIIMASLEKDPKNRPKSIDEVRIILDQAAHGRRFGNLQMPASVRVKAGAAWICKTGRENKLILIFSLDLD